MNCAEFLARYSEYRDGTVTAPRELRRFRRHVAVCPRCRAFDVALRDGVAALRDVPAVAPSPSFRRRLEARLAAERAGAKRPRAPVLVRLAGALLVLAAMSLLGWEAARRAAPGAVPSLPPVVFPKPLVNAGVPLVTFQDPRASVLAGNPYPYGTAFVQPPARR
jgi:hypothetical protein